MTSGIYRILNLITRKSYIGKAENISRRFTNHKAKFRSHKHGNEYLQNSYIKHGAEVFAYIVLEKCPVEELGKRETFWVRTLNSMSYQNGYNIQEPKEDGGNIVSEETKKRISASHNGKIRSIEHRRNISLGKKGKVFFCKSFALLSPTGQIVTGTNLRQLAITHNLNGGHLCGVLNGKRKAHKGWTKV